jgi:hypothetical protein
MKGITLRAFTGISLVFIIATLSNASCTPTGSAPEKTVRKPGSFLFAFDVNQVSELTVMKRDPSAWTATLKRAGNTWQIVEPPAGKKLLDARVDDKFVNHLLDTLRTLEFSEPAPRGSLESFGLVTPRIALRWKTPDGTQEIWLGNPQKDLTAYAKHGDEVLLVRGATLQMLEYLTSFDSLRHRILLTQDSDDIDTFEYFKEGGRVFFAQRESGTWVNEKRKPFKWDCGGFLDVLTHLRIQSFNDDEVALNSRILEMLKSKPRYRVIFKDRQDLATELRVSGVEGGLWAWVSTRPASAFLLHPSATRHFELKTPLN